MVNEPWFPILLQAVGLAMLVLEAFLPSHGVFGVIGLMCLGCGVYSAFQISPRMGYVSIGVEVVAVPTIFVLWAKYFRRTAIGRRIVPPNPVLTDADRGVDVRDIRPLIGASGRSLSPLRPVGVCDFAGRRVQCVAETGLIDSGMDVEGVGVVGDSLSVRPKANHRPA